MHLRKWAVASTLLFTVLSGRAGASTAVIDFTQDGANVVATASGKVDLTGLSLFLSGGGTSQVIPLEGVVTIGVDDPVDIYAGISGPASFGSGLYTFPDSASGGVFGVVDHAIYLVLPEGYTSGTPLDSSSTFDGSTFASMGLKPGSYVYTWDDSSTLTINIGVPEPSTWAMMLLGFAGLGFAGYRNAKKAGATPT